MLRMRKIFDKNRSRFEIIAEILRKLRKPTCKTSIISHCNMNSARALSVDPMRVVTVPNTLNGRTGLICSYVGNRKDLEDLTIDELLMKSRVLKFHGYPEPLEGPSIIEGSNGAVKICAKNLAGAPVRG